MSTERAFVLALMLTLAAAAALPFAQARPQPAAPAAATAAKSTALQRLPPRGLVEQVQRRLGGAVQFEPLQLGNWTLSGAEADFELWGLLHAPDQPVRMLRVRGRIERHSFELDRLELQAFDERQALQPAPRAEGR